MTCIVGLIEKETVYIGGDSAGVQGYEIKTRQDEKVFKKDNMIFGFTSSFRMGQLLRYNFTIPDHDPRKDDFEYLCTDFIDALTECFTKKGYAKITSNQVSGGTFLLGYKGHLYAIYNDFQVSKVFNTYDACGCGEPYALGALRATENSKMAPKKRIELALSVAAHFSAAVRPPFTVVSIKS